MSYPLFIGIDVSSKENSVCCLSNDDEKHPLTRFSVSNNRPGIHQLKEKIDRITEKHAFDRLLFGLEHTGCYSTHVAMYLQQHLKFNCSNVTVYKFNPGMIKQFKKAHFLDAPKNDRVDAWYIAARLKSGLLPHPFTWNEPLLALQKLTRARYHLIQNLVRESNVLMSNLYLKCSDYNLAFNKTLSATSLAVMEEFQSAEELAETSLDKLIDFLILHGRNRISDPEIFAKQLRKAAHSSYRLPKAMADSVNLAMASNIRVIRTLQEQIKSLQKAIQDHLGTIPQTLDSIPGIGPTFASGIISEIGDINKFNSHKQLAKFAGLAWTENQSGDFTAKRTRLINSGNRFLRYYLIEAANSVKVRDPVFADYYAKKSAEPKEFAHKRSLALTARKLVRLVYTLLKTNQLYQPKGEYR